MFPSFTSTFNGASVGGTRNGDCSNHITSSTAHENDNRKQKRRWNQCFIECVENFTRFLGIFTAIVMAGTGVDIVYHQRRTGYYFIGAGVALLLLETAWILGVFLKVCIRNEQHRAFRCWRIIYWFRTWKKALVYAPGAVLPILYPHRLWIAYVAGGQMLALAVLYLLLALLNHIAAVQRNVRRQRLLNGSGGSGGGVDGDSFERLEDMVDASGDIISDPFPNNGGLPEPMPGSSHSLSDSLTEIGYPDAILEI